ncbi:MULTISPECIES: hypothetical protein [Haloarcula]|nr:hypothetical protein [Halomicroarcula sp. SHR3]
MSSNEPDTDSPVASAQRLLALVKQVVSIVLALATLAEMAGWL